VSVTLPLCSRRFCLRLEFDGSLFCGWQLQSSEAEAVKSSGQGEVERALRVLTRSPQRVVVQGCGRTDAGVSALEFFAHFDLPELCPLPEAARDIEKFRHSLNGILPDGIAVTELSAVAADFHALKDVTWKTYEYTLLVRRTKPTFERDRCYWIPETLETFKLDELRKGLALLKGKKDFVNFAAADHTAQTTVREIFETSIEVTPAGELRLRFTGEGFLKYMVRNLVGTLVEVGVGKRDVASIEHLLNGQLGRKDCGHCAPSCGLRLVRVCYNEDWV